MHDKNKSKRISLQTKTRVMHQVMINKVVMLNAHVMTAKTKTTPFMYIRIFNINTNKCLATIHIAFITIHAFNIC